MIGLTLSSMLELKAKANQSSSPGWGKAKSIIMVYLQGGPSHLDLWDPKKDVPDNVRSAFNTIPTSGNTEVAEPEKESHSLIPGGPRAYLFIPSRL